MKTLLNKTNEELKNEIYNIVKEETGFSNWNNESVIKGIADSLFQCSKMVYNILKKMSQNLTIDDAAGFYLDLWGMLSGIKRKDATTTIRKVEITSYSSGKIKAGLWIQLTSLDIRYKVLEEKEFIENETFTILTEGEFEGSKYNLIGNYTPYFTKVIDGVDKVKLSDIIKMGEDEENDDRYRARLRALWQSVTENSVPSKYITYTMKVDGVKEVLVIRAPRNGGSVDVVVAFNNGVNKLEKIEEIYLTLENNQVVAKDLNIISVETKEINLKIQYKGNFNKETILEKIETFFNKLKIGETLKIASSKDNSLYYYLLNGLQFETLVITPNVDIVATSYQLLTMGDIEIDRI